MKGIKRKLSIIGKVLSQRSHYENELEEALPNQFHTPLIELFKIGWRHYDALSRALDAYLTQYKTPLHTLLRGVVESLQDLRRFLRVMSVLLREGGIYQSEFADSKYSQHGINYGYLKKTEGKKSKYRFLRGDEEEYDYIDEDNVGYDKHYRSF